MKHKKLNVGFIGAGFIGQIAHIENFAQLNNCNMYALAEMRSELRAKVGQRYNFSKTYQQHEEMLADPDLDAVVVVVPRPYTASIVMDCIKAGKHVLSEKPMAGNFKSGLELVNAAERYGVHYCVGYMKRYDEGVIQAKKMLDDVLKTQIIGNILNVRAYCYMGESYCNAGGHETTQEQVNYNVKQGAIAPDHFNEDESLIFARYVNVYSHLTNLLQYLFEKKPNVEFFKYIRKDAHICVLNYDHYLATIETGEASNRQWDEGIEIQFEHGKLVVELPPALLRNVPAKVTLYKAGKQQEVIQPLVNWTWAFANQAKAFVNDIIENKPSVINAKHALKDLEVIEEFWEHKC
jgi:predicted dehydrogenase